MFQKGKETEFDRYDCDMNYNEQMLIFDQKVLFATNFDNLCYLRVFDVRKREIISDQIIEGKRKS